MNLKKRFLPGFFILNLFLGILISSCAHQSGAFPSAIPKPAAVKIGVQPFMGMGPIFIAQEEGFFTKHGIQAELVEIKSSAEAVPLLIQGQLDMTSMAVNPGFFNAVAKSGGIRAALGQSQWKSDGCISTGVLARAADAARLADSRSWKNLKVALDPVGLQSVQGYMLSLALAKGDLALADIQTQKIPPANTTDALKSGAIDLLQITEPWITRVTTTGDAQVILAGQDVLPNGQLSVFVYAPRLLKDADLGLRLAQAYLEGVRQFQQGPTDRNVAILARYTRLEPELLKKVCWPYIPADGSANLDSMLEFEKWAASQGWVDKMVEVKDFWDGRFVAAAPAATAQP